MSYLIVSLPGDAESQAADRFARWLAGRRTPVRLISDRAPDHGEVREAAKGVGCAVLFGHDGGGAMRPCRRVEADPATHFAWANAQQLGAMFAGLRVFAFACNTTGSHSRDDVPALGAHAVKAGVRVFAGHPTFVAPDSGAAGRLGEELRRATAAAILRFIDGENNERTLRLAAQASFGKAQTHFSIFPADAHAIQGAMSTLRVIRGDL